MLTTNLKLHNLETLSIDDSVVIFELEDFLAWKILPAADDIYIELQENEIFKEYGISANLRSWAADKIRKDNQINFGHEHATLNQIYELLLSRTQKDLKIPASTFVEIELDMISSHLSLQKQAFEFIEEKSNKNTKIFLITELEYTKPEIITILNRLNPNIIKNISGYFTPCELKIRSFTKQLNAILVSDVFSGSTISYIGQYLDDKNIKDSQTHLHYYKIGELWTDVSQEILVNRQNMAVQILPDIRYKKSLSDRSRQPISLYKATNAWHEFGYKSIGPIIYDFISYVKNKVINNKSHVAFLMRDGFLPMNAFKEIYPDHSCGELSISRYTAISSSIRTKQNIVDLVQSNYYFNELTTLLKLVSLNEKEQFELTEEIKRSKTGNLYKYLTELLVSDKYFHLITKRSKEKAQRLKTHIYKNLKCKSGDNVTLVDLGYAGTVQNYISSIENELELNFSGCYLITDSKSKLEFGSLKNSLINTEDDDPRIVNTLLANISLFEMVCSAPRLSTVDYDVCGNAITSEGNSSSQIPESMLIEIHEGVKSYCYTAHKIPLCNNEKFRRAEVIVNLARYLYSPTRTETALFKGLKFDLDMGTNAKIELFNSEKLKFELENFGFQNANGGDLKSKRFHMPYEIRAISPFVASAYFDQQRYGARYISAAIDLHAEPAKIEEHDSHGKTLSTFSRYAEKTFNDFLCLVHQFIYTGNSLLLKLPSSRGAVIQINELFLRNGSDGKIVGTFRLHDSCIEHRMVNVLGNLYSTHDEFVVKIKFPSNHAQHIGKVMLVSISFRIL